MKFDTSRMTGDVRSLAIAHNQLVTRVEALEKHQELSEEIDDAFAAGPPADDDDDDDQKDDEDGDDDEGEGQARDAGGRFEASEESQKGQEADGSE